MILFHGIGGGGQYKQHSSVLLSHSPAQSGYCLVRHLQKHERMHQQVTKFTSPTWLKHYTRLTAIPAPLSIGVERCAAPSEVQGILGPDHKPQLSFK